MFSKIELDAAVALARALSEEVRDHLLPGGWRDNQFVKVVLLKPGFTMMGITGDGRPLRSIHYLWVRRRGYVARGIRVAPGRYDLSIFEACCRND